MNEQEILKLDSPRKSYWYCYYNKRTANIKAHEQIILYSKNIDITYCLVFAMHISGVDIQAFEEVIINSGDIEACLIFAKDIKGSNKQRLSEAVLASGNLDYIKAFYNNIDFDKTKYERLLLFI
jgi:hypothetical protein